jgi:hypothetical protein
MRGVISEALEKHGLTEKAVLCVEEENENGLFEPVKSQCINAFEPPAGTMEDRKLLLERDEYSECIGQACDGTCDDLSCDADK